MDEHADTDKDRTLRVQLELHVDRQPISGHLRTERGEDERFEGRLCRGISPPSLITRRS